MLAAGDTFLAPLGAKACSQGREPLGRRNPMMLFVSPARGGIGAALAGLCFAQCTSTLRGSRRWLPVDDPSGAETPP